MGCCRAPAWTSSRRCTWTASPCDASPCSQLLPLLPLLRLLVLLLLDLCVFCVSEGTRPAQRFAGGVFAVIRGKPDKVWHSLAGKGMPSYIAPSGTTYMLMYNPQHLLGVEAPLSIMSAVRLGKSTGAQLSRDS